MIDPEIQDIYLEGTTHSLDVVRAMALAWQADQSNLQVLQILDQSFLDLKGNSRMVGAQYMGDFTEQVEGVLSNIIANKTDVSKDFQLLFGEIVTLLPKIINCEVSDDNLPDRVHVVSGLLNEFLSKGAEDFRYLPLDPDEELPEKEIQAVAEEKFENIELEEESRKIFLEDAAESTEEIDQIFQSVEKTGEGDISSLLRKLHTLKGDSNTLELKNLGRLLHEVESLVLFATDEGGALNRKYVELLRISNDRVATVLDEIDTNNRELLSDSYIEALSSATKGLPWNMPGTSLQEGEENKETESTNSERNATEAGADPKADVVDVSQLKQDVSPPELPEPNKSSADEKTVNNRSQVQSQRTQVRTDVMDRVIDSFSQLKSFEALLGIQSKNIQAELEELKLTTIRLDTQLNDLGLEAASYSSPIYQENLTASSTDLNSSGGKATKVNQLQLALSETSKDLNEIYSSLNSYLEESDKTLLRQSRRTAEVEEELLNSRLVPFSTFSASLQRTVRQAARTTNKVVELVIAGENEELDRVLLQKLVGQIEHVLRNAVVHGIESVATRRAKGKSDSGRIFLDVRRGRKDIVVSISDDGSGLDFTSIARLAKEKDLISFRSNVEKSALSKMIFLSGFTTAKSVNTMAGRGVGLDSVSNTVKQFGGSIDVKSEDDKGCEFIIRVPYKLATADALLVQVGEHNYAIPFGVPTTITHIETSKLQSCYSNELNGIEFGGKSYTIQYLGTLFGIADPNISESSKWQPVILLDIGSRRIGLHVDKLLGNQQILLKNVGPQMSSLPWFNGGAVLKNGEVALILDLERIVTSLPNTQFSVVGTEAVEAPNRLVMVVDDSITIRTVTYRLLVRNDFDVVTAKDGVEALELLEQHNPMIFLVDVEMPRMDGYEFTKNIRSSEQHSDTPIIMISTRVGGKNRRVAEELGVNQYMGKPYDNKELIDSIQLLTAQDKRS